MAKAGDKRRLEANQRKLVLLRAGILAAIAVHVVVRLILYRSSVSKRTIFGFLATGLIEAFCYRALAQLAVPTYGERGELIDGGADLTLGGITAAYFDAIYIAAFVQVTAVLSGKFWLVLLVIPMYGAFQLWTQLLGPYFMAPSAQERPEAAAEKTKRERAEKRAARRTQRYA